MYDSLLSRSFSKQEKKKLGYGGLLVFLVFLFSFSTVFKSFFTPFPVLNLRLSIKSDQKLNTLNVTAIFSSNKEEEVTFLLPNDTTTSHKLKLDTNDTSTSHKLKLDTEMCEKRERTELCEMKGDIRINGNISTVFIVSSEQPQWRIRPYARNGDFQAMNSVREWSLKPLSNPPQCSLTYNTSAILFSLGGYSGNHFHLFTDVILPLYSTARRFNGSVQLLVTDNKPWLLSKFRTILNALSKFDIIDADRSTAGILCFNSITVGLKRQSNRELSVDPIPMKDFRQFLRSSYSLKKTRALKIISMTRSRSRSRPRLLIISRKRSRAFTNVDSIAKMAKTLGFKVVVHEPDADVTTSAKVMNSCDVVLGVHGAGLTNILFLPENAILIQVVPFGGAEWVSKRYFEEPSKDMNIRYLEYKISIDESSLVQQYPSDDVVLRDPYAIQKQGWMVFKSIYFDNQNISLHLNRFRPTLFKALELLHH
ncbi:alpha-1,3-arabinosyltransferase XAT3-like [Euphorbia lathyris]|uniref:alpha-1,3-arabinosyltransferase XAT3-like n=1 Tax=Euphorbia lathyris TaxID=212925 RepID=UPI0033131029